MAFKLKIRNRLNIIIFNFILKNNIVKIRKIPNFINENFIIASRKGLFLIKRNALYKIFHGIFYGITLDKNYIFVFERVTTENGRILRIPCVEGKLKKNKTTVFADKLSAGCHQIDIKYDFLYITDTYNNRIIKINIHSGHRCDYFPKGRLDNGRESENYAHINSIFIKNDIYLFCHNESEKTGRFSSILKVDNNFETIEEIATCAKNGHNIINMKSNLYYCDSMNNTLMRNNDIVFKADMFTRGLSITDNYIVIGGSEYAKREDREKVSGCIYFIDNNFKKILTIPMPGMVLEIRSISSNDYSLSESVS